MKKLACAFLCLSTSAAFAEVTWTEADGVGTVSGSGSYALDGAKKLSALKTRPEGSGTITLTGEGLSFTNEEKSAVLAQLGGETAFDLPVTASGALETGFKVDDGLFKDSGAVSLSTSQFRKIFSNLNLNDYCIESARPSGSSVTATDAVVLPFFVTRGDGWLEAQMQFRDNAWVKCLPVRLQQNGADIEAKLLDKRYASVNDGALVGMDFYGDQPICTIYRDMSLGYDLRQFFLVPGQSLDATLRFTKPLRVGEGKGLSVGTNMTVIADGDGTLAADNVVTEPLSVEGRLVLTNMETIVFTNAFSGGGILEFGGLIVSPDPATAEVDATLDGGFLGSAEKTVASELAVYCLSNVTATSTGENIGVHDLRTAFFTNDGETVSVQFRTHDTTWLKNIRVTIRQDGKNLKAKITKAEYCHINVAMDAQGVVDESIDFDTLESGTPGASNRCRAGYSIVTSPTSGGYGIGSMKLFSDVTKERDFSFVVKTTFAAENKLNGAGAQVVQHGGKATVTHVNGLPAKSVYEVRGGGVLTLSAPGCGNETGISGGGTTIKVCKGSTLEIRKAAQLGFAAQKVVVDGGTFSQRPDEPTLRDGDCYVNRLTLMNGARVVGAGVRATYTYGATWTVGGTSPSYVDTKILVASTSSKILTFDVADVTGDAEPDLTLSQEIDSFDESQHYKFYLAKTGAGTMRLNGVNTWNRGKVASWQNPIRLQAGTVELGVNDCMNEKLGVSFQGGTLALVAGVTNNVGAATLEAASGLSLAADASLLMTNLTVSANCGVADRLAITAAEGATVRIGTAADCPAETLRRIRYNGHRVLQNADGSLEPIYGAVILVK